MEWIAAKAGYDEALAANDSPRDFYGALISTLQKFDSGEISRREQLQHVSLINQGITFTVYGREEGVERIFPFDFVPRVISASEWNTVELGLVQRLETINLFLADIYSDQKCLRDGVIPHDLVFERGDFRRAIIGTRPRHGIYTHIVGTDLLRGDSGEFLVLEDNCRCPSGVSYVLENRNLLSRVFPELFSEYGVRPVEQYPHLLLETLRFTAPRGRENPTVAVLTPGVYNSAYFEHSFLAREMGVPLVEGRDLIVEDDQVYMRTTRGKQRVDVIYRRIDDEYIDPVVFDPSSMLGVPGLIHAWQAGNVSIANAPGAGVADDKAIYPWVPDLVKYYLDEDIQLPQIKTWVGRRPDEATYIRENLADLVVKLAGGAGGYGMLVGPTASSDEIASFREAFDASPEAYIAQPLVEFSSHPTYVDGKFAPRRVDLRPFALCGEHIRVLPGGLTRVALEEGSYVVNSSQGGGSKDTWILADLPGESKS
ncbi:MAG: circularly permuted type 2 ATP-grasp protein [Planctomycetota bacterium]|nr:circularly permuted type 2 ATP-grasp protein [Planctomycetota bacterium]